MIKNERQLRIARTKQESLEAARGAAHDDKLSWRSYTDLIDDLTADIVEYEEIREGRVRQFALDCLDSVGDAIIKARISRGWTQKQLAERLGVAEQQVQRDEAKDFENAGLARVAEVIDALDYELVGTLRPKVVMLPIPPESGTSMSTAVSASIADSSRHGGAIPEEANFLRLFLFTPSHTRTHERVQGWHEAKHGERLTNAD